MLLFITLCNVCLMGYFYKVFVIFKIIFIIIFLTFDFNITIFYSMTIQIIDILIIIICIHNKLMCAVIIP